MQLGAYTPDSIVPVRFNTYDSDAFTPITFASLAVTLDIIRSGVVYGVPVASAGSTDTSVATTAFAYAIDGTGYTKAAVAAGTALGAGTILADDWGLYVINVNAAGTITVTAAAGNFDGSYATEAAALGALAATVSGLAATQHPVAYFTVETAAGQAFVGNTDALNGGASGNPADTTNYYDFQSGDGTNSNGLVSVSVDHGSVTGRHLITADNANGELGFANGDDVDVRVTAGTVDSISRVGTIIASFAAASAGLSSTQSTDIQAAANAALVALALDHLMAVADADDVADNSALAKLAASDGDWSGFSATTDSLEAVRDHVGDGTNLTEAGGDGDHLTEAGGTGDHLTAIDLPNQTMNITGNLSGSVGSVTGAVGSVTGNVGGNVTGTVSGVTPAAAGAQMDLVDAPNATAVTAIQSGLATATTLGTPAGADLAADIAENQTDLNSVLALVAASAIRSALGLSAANLTAELSALPAATRSEMDSNSTQLAAIVADTNELQSDDIPGTLAGLENLSSAGAQTAAAAAITAAFGITTSTVNDASATTTGFTVTADVGTDIRLGVLRFTDGALAGESRLVTHTGTTVAVVQPTSVPAGLATVGPFSAVVANGVAYTFRPL